MTGYPWHSVKTPEHEQFLKAYQARFKDHPRVASVMAYATIHSIASYARAVGFRTLPELIARLG